MADATSPAANGALLRMDQRRLDEIFSAAPAGPIPHGPAEGLALIAPGTSLAAPIAQLVRVAVWQGKTFDAAGSRLVNRVTPIGIPAVPAHVYEAPSRFDGKPCIVLDYSKTSIIAWFVGDEIRAIGPGRYLGRAYVLGRYVFGFALQF